MKPALFSRRPVGAVTFLFLSGLCTATLTPAQAQASLTTIASFNGTNGAQPRGGVTLDSSGNLFGTTQYGGASGNGTFASGNGTVFEIPKGSASITDLAAFTGANGAAPIGGVTFDSSGNLFGTTLNGGANGNGTVFEIAKGSTSITDLADFTGTNGANPIGNLTFDNQGNLFGTTFNGGASSNSTGTVFEVAKGSTAITTLASFNGTNGAVPYSGVTFDSQGNLFGTTSEGGASYGATSGGGFNFGDGTVYEIAKGSTAITTLASFNGTNGNFPIGNLTFDSQGNLFGTTQNGGANSNGTVFEIAKGGTAITTLASFNGANGAQPYGGVTFDSSDNLFGTTFNGGANDDGTVYEIAKGSTAITTLVTFNGANGTDPAAGVTIDSSGNLFGMTFVGGALGGGTVFEVAGAGSPAAVPEASTTVSFSLLLTLGLGGAVLARRKRSQKAS